MNPIAHTFANPKSKYWLPFVATAFLYWSSGALAEETAQPALMPAPAGMSKPLPPPPPLPLVPRPGKAIPDLPIFQKIGPGLFALGDIQISKSAKSVSLPVVVNMNKGLLEYILVRNGGKTHESLFRTSIDPTQLQLAMLLIGTEGTDKPLIHQGDRDVPRGNPVEITVHYLNNGRMVPLKPENWISRKADNTLVDSEPLQWVFTGSMVSNGKFMAQADGSMIAIYHDPSALIDNASPGGESDRIWFVKEGAVPPVGTPVTLTIRVKN